MTRKALVLGILGALLASGSAQAADSYRITAGGDQNWGPQSGGLDRTDSAQVEATGTMTGDQNAVGSVDYQLQAGPGIARVSMDGEMGIATPSMSGPTAVRAAKDGCVPSAIEE